MAFRTLRMDGSPLGKVRTTPQGGAVVPAVLTRTGVFTYEGLNGPIREYRPPEEVFNPESLATLANAPVTREHPPEKITIENYRKHARGNLVTGTVETTPTEVTSDLAIQDSELLGDIESEEKREVSLGYDADADETPGVSPEGETYDRVQRNIRYNHVAIVKRGRAGSTVSLRLDSVGDSVIESNPPIEPRDERLSGYRS